MRALVVENLGKKSKLLLKEVPLPRVRKREVLVRIRATSVNQADLLQRRGLYPPPSGVSEILGLDIAGKIEVKGERSSKFKAGDHVFGFVAGGGYAEYVAVDERLLWRMPPNLDFEAAAAVGEVFATGFLNLVMLGKLEGGERVLIHGGSGGVGTAAIQIAKSFGANVFCTVGTKEGAELCKELGASHTIDYREDDFEKMISEISGGVDIVLDFVGAPYLNKHLNILRTRGRLVLIGLKGGTATEVFLPPIISKRLTIIGSVLRSLDLHSKIELAERFRQAVIPLLASGEIYPIIDSIFPITQAEEAHHRFQQSKHLGKIVLTWLDV